LVDNPRWDDWIDENLIALSFIRLWIGDTDQRLIKDEEIAPVVHGSVASAKSATTTKEIIVVDSDSDSERNKKSTGRGAGANKRQKTMDMPVDEDIIILDAPPASVAQGSSLKNTYLKSRKHFAADFTDLKAQGLELGGSL